MTKRLRTAAFAAAAAFTACVATVVQAHHGWSSFDNERPLYVEGTVKSVKWQNPHAEVVLDVPQGVKLPADLAGRPVPAQSAPVDGAALLAKTQLPRTAAGAWTLELAPLSRMQAWAVSPLKAGQKISVVGFAPPGEKGERLMRVEYLYVDGKAYGLRSSPAR